MAEMMSLNISESLIKQAIQDEVNAGIVRALGDPAKVVKDAVRQITNTYVDSSDGKPCKCSDYRAVPYFDYLVQNLISEFVREEIKNYIAEHSEDFKQQMIASLADKKFKESAAENFISCLLAASQNSYRIPVSISFKKCKEF